jgi:hypothetical protein
MTPTLVGRWQTRILLLGTVGLIVTLIFGRMYHDYRTPLAVLGYVILFGFGWDILYNVAQTFRWDHDWPPVFQLAAGIVEGIFLWAMMVLVNLPGVTPHPPFSRFLAHYAAVWLSAFLASQGPVRTIFPRWRFNGGRWL